MFLEIIQILWLTITGILKAFISAIWNNLGSILELVKIRDYFTPAGIIAFYIGVPTFVVSIILIFKKQW